mgnify:CR=1 FL=1
MAATNRIEDALLNFTRATQIDPRLGGAYHSRAKLYFERGEIEAAIEDLSAAISVEPQSPGLYLTRGQVYIVSGNADLAISDLEQVLALTGDEAMIIAAKRLLSLVR